MDEIKIILLNKDLSFNKNIFVDVQEYNSQINIGNLKVDVYKRLYIDYIVRDITLQSYIKINNDIFKVIKVNTYLDYQEIFITKVENIKINNESKVAIVVTSDDKKIDYKEIITDFIIKTGDIIDHQDNKWLITSQIKQFYNYNKATIRKVEQLIKFKFKDTTVELPCFVEDSQQSIVNGEYFKIADGSITITTGVTNFTDYLKEQIRFIWCRRCYIIQGFTECERGLIKFYCKKDSFIQDQDDKINNIAYNKDLQEISIGSNSNNNNNNQTDPVKPVEPPVTPTYIIVGEAEILANKDYEYTYKPMDGKCTIELDEDIESLNLVSLNVVNGKFIIKGLKKNQYIRINLLTNGVKITDKNIYIKAR